MSVILGTKTYYMELLLLIMIHIPVSGKINILSNKYMKAETTGYSWKDWGIWRNLSMDFSYSMWWTYRSIWSIDSLTGFQRIFETWRQLLRMSQIVDGSGEFYEVFKSWRQIGFKPANFGDVYLSKLEAAKWICGAPSIWQNFRYFDRIFF